MTTLSVDDRRNAIKQAQLPDTLEALLSKEVGVPFDGDRIIQVELTAWEIEFLVDFMGPQNIYDHINKMRTDKQKLWNERIRKNGGTFDSHNIFRKLWTAIGKPN
jgi:hypothetical protein